MLSGTTRKYRVGGKYKTPEEAVKAAGVPQIGEFTPNGHVVHAIATPWRVGFHVTIYLVDGLDAAKQT